MAEMAQLAANQARVVDSDDEKKVPKDEKKQETLVSWVVARTDEWRTHRQGNYEADWDRYERLWRGIHSASEKERGSERSTFVSPALSEAVESNVAEIEEAVFGRGDLFDMRAEVGDNPQLAAALEKNKVRLKEDLIGSSFVANTSEVLINGAVYGLGVGEILVEDADRREIYPAMGPDGSIEAQVKVINYDYACLRSVNPRNFLWDPNARGVDDGLGVAIEENVGLHLIRDGQERGDYLDKEPVRAYEPDPNLRADAQGEKAQIPADTAHVIRYYGRVPAHLLDKAKGMEVEEDAVVNLFPDEEKSEEVGETAMVEAVVVIANKSVLLVGEPTPYLMADRPVTIFKWDIVPGRLVGRGVGEKGQLPQRLLDAELRYRMDCLAFANSPMMTFDATRLPRGFEFKSKPGKSIPIAGDPNTAFKELRFGAPDQSTWNQSQMLDQMVQRATGALNTTQLATSAAGGDARTGALSMGLSGVVKRSKRTLMNFTDSFFIPTLKKILWRNMQYSPQRYMPLNSTFVASSVIGIMQREYEMMNLTQLMNSMQPGSPEQRSLLMGLIGNTGLQNRAQIIETLQKQQQLADQAAQVQGGQQDPQMAALQQQLAQVQIQLQIAKGQAEIRKLNAQATELEAQAQLELARARTEAAQPILQAREIALKGIYNTPQEQMAQEFDHRMRVAEQITQAADIESNERIAAAQTQASVAKERIKAAATVEAARTKARGEVVQAAVNPPAPPAPTR